jgi:hypothetical protein
MKFIFKKLLKYILHVKGQSKFYMEVYNPYKERIQYTDKLNLYSCRIK